MGKDKPVTQEDLVAHSLLIAEVYELAGESRRSSETQARELGQTAARWHVLSVVSDGPRTVASAARRLGLARQSVQRVVDDLVAAGQLERRDNPDHARAPLIALTSQGQATLDALMQRPDSQGVLERAELRQDELDHARGVLRKLLAALQQQGDRVS